MLTFANTYTLLAVFSGARGSQKGAKMAATWEPKSTVGHQVGAQVGSKVTFAGLENLY